MACRFLEIVTKKDGFFGDTMLQEVIPICRIKREHKGTLLPDMQEALRELGVNYLPNYECQFYNLNKLGMCPRSKQ